MFGKTTKKITGDTIEDLKNRMEEIPGLAEVVQELSRLKPPTAENNIKIEISERDFGTGTNRIYEKILK